MSNAKTDIFDAVEVGNKVSKQDYKAALQDLRVALINMQYDLQQAGFSVLVLLAGNDRKSANELLDVLHEWLDARYLHSHVFLPPTPHERDYPAYWRYWRVLPPAGRIGIYLGGWPVRALAERLLGGGTDALLDRRINHINALEQCLSNDGTVVLKLWLHLPKKAARKRLQQAQQNPDNEPYVRQQDWRIYEHYDDIVPVAEHLLVKTDTGQAPWNIIEATDARYRNLTAAHAILSSVRRRLDSPAAAAAAGLQAAPLDIPAPAGALDTVDLGASLGRKEYRKKRESLQGKLNRLVIEARGKAATVLVFEGWDAAGKGGVIRRMTSALFAEDYRVFPIAAPTDEERARHYLWRFWHRLPGPGKLVIFDRSWYGRVLVERVEGFAGEDEWRRAYFEINDFEQQLTAHGITLCKFWLHIDPDEQLRRFQAREQTGYKKYKITDEDYRNREQWQAYTAAVNEMVARTSTAAAPWHLVPANDKKWARIQVLETVVAALQRRR